MSNETKKQNAVRIETVPLGSVAHYVERELVATADALHPYDYRRQPVICARRSAGGLDLLDGYHRIAGLLAHGVSLDAEIPVIVSAMGALNDRAADKGSARHEDAIEEIERLAQGE